jgi:hypothetical protein
MQILLFMNSKLRRDKLDQTQVRKEREKKKRERESYLVARPNRSSKIS